MTKTIPLSGNNPDGLCAIVDDEDYERASAHRWFAHRAARSLTVYAKSGKGGFLHRLIVGAKTGEIVDHVDADGLNCTRSNLRKVTASENVRNDHRHRRRRLFDEWESRL